MSAATQPAPFGCRFLAIGMGLSFLTGLAGAGIGGQVFNNRPTTQVISGGQNVSVQESSAIIDASRKTSPAVVSITLQTTSRSFFGPVSSSAAGTGFIITADGLIATNRHVVESAQNNLTVVTNDGKSYPAVIKALDPVIDFALIKIDAKNLPVANLGDSDAVQVGQQVIAIGNALGEFQNSVTSGVISARERSIEAGSESGGSNAEQLDNLLQTDAAINPGNSGGPLVNLAGQVIAINTAVAGEGQGLGFAIPINQAKQAIESFQKRGSIVRPSLGVRYQAITKELASLKKLPVDQGALLSGTATAPAVVPNSPAAQAGLRDGDILTAVEGQTINQDRSLSGLLSKYNPGDSIELTYFRDGKEARVRVTLSQR